MDSRLAREELVQPPAEVLLSRLLARRWKPMAVGPDVQTQRREHEHRLFSSG
jgi:hypothetical protein